MLKPQPLCSWDTRAQSPLPFNLTLKCMQTVLFPTHSTFPLCHELQMRSSFHKSSHVQGSWNPGRSRLSRAVFRPVAASSNLSAPSPGSQPPQHDSLLLFHCQGHKELTFSKCHSAVCFFLKSLGRLIK